LYMHAHWPYSLLTVYVVNGTNTTLTKFQTCSHFAVTLELC